MNRIAQMPAAERAELFAETADRKGLPEAIIEKDFWVCWVLKQLFSIEALSGRLLFKGGTSLSKIFHAINRFSEDIDLAVDYAALGFTGDLDPRREEISKTRRAGILAEMLTACRRYIAGEFLHALTARCEELLGATGSWSAGVSGQDPNVVRFRYPTATAKSLAYVVPQVVLELGTHAEFVPRDRFSIRSFAAEEFPDLVADGQVRSWRCSPSGPSGRRRQSFTRNTTARRKSHSPSDTPVITMMLPCWQKGQSGPRRLRTCRCLPRW